MPMLAGEPVDAADLTFPDPATGYANGVNSISATSFADLPTIGCTATIVNPHPTAGMLVDVRFAAWMVAMARDARRADDRWAVHQTQCIACATPEVIAAAIAAQKAREVAAVRVDVVDEVIVDAEGPADIPDGWTAEQPERVAEGVYRTTG